MRSDGWKLPAIVCAVSVMVLLFILSSNILRPARSSGSAMMLEAKHRANAQLEQRVATLRGMMEAGVCKENGRYTLQSREMTEEERRAVPALLEDRHVLPGSLPSGRAFEGSVVELLRQAIVLILTDAGEHSTKSSLGTGFFVAPNTIVTNRHVVDMGPSRRVRIANRKLGVKEARVIAESPKGEIGSADFAILQVSDAGQISPLAIGPQAEILTNIIAAGFPSMVVESDERFQKLLLGEANELPEITVTTGVIGNVQKTDGMTTLLHQAQVTKGNSGGPLVDRCGRVLGINTYILAAQEGRWNFALSAEDISQFLSSNNIAATTVRDPCVPEAHPKNTIVKPNAQEGSP